MVAITSSVPCKFFVSQFKTHNNLKAAAPLPMDQITSSFVKHTIPSLSLNHTNTTFSKFHKKGGSQIRRSSINTQNPKGPIFSEETTLGKNGTSTSVPSSRKERNRTRTQSLLLFVFWAVLMYYIFFLAPNQTLRLFVLILVDDVAFRIRLDPAKQFPFAYVMMDLSFMKVLFFLKGDDGFRMNEVFAAWWYMMGVLLIFYTMLLIPNGRSLEGNIPVWPFVILSYIAGAYALLPYFVPWRPPPPPIEESAIRRWPLNILESKFTAGITATAGLGLIIHAGLANGDVWKELFRYFTESRLVHVTCIDFILCSASAPFWVYNDMTAQKWDDKGSWLVPLSLIPILGPALYGHLCQQHRICYANPPPKKNDVASKAI